MILIKIMIFFSLSPLNVRFAKHKMCRRVNVAFDCVRETHNLRKHKVIWKDEGKNAIIPNEIIPVDIEFQALLPRFGFSLL